MSEQLIDNVSDTARWVAAYRARESTRPDALFRDPLAARLAGTQGQRIATRSRRVTGDNGWPLVTRTKLIDDLIEQSIAAGCDCVLNLAAGLDTRPYRLELPSELSWIEVDLPEIIEHKARTLHDARPRCELRRERVDLADAAKREALLDQIARKYKRVLVLTEGLLMYLDAATVETLAHDLHARTSLHTWIVDLASPAVVAAMHKTMGSELDNAPMQFAPANGVAFFEALGWRVKDLSVLAREAVRYKRAPWFFRLLMALPDPNPRQLGTKHWGAVVRFER